MMFMFLRSKMLAAVSLALSLWCCVFHCLTGPSPNTPGFPNDCVNADADHDLDVDLADIAAFLNSLEEMGSVYYTAVGARE